VDDRTGRDPAEHPLALEEQPQPADGLRVRHEQLPVEPGDVEDRRHVAVLERAQPHDLVTGERFGCGDHDVRERLTEPFAGAHERSARAEARDEDVDAVERRDDLGAGPVVVGTRIGLVGVLERHEE
jgi:hypothetical protein